jgi:hypothetical protein
MTVGTGWTGRCAMVLGLLGFVAPVCAQEPDTAAVAPTDTLRCEGHRVSAVELESAPPDLGQDRIPGAVEPVLRVLVYPWTSGPDAVLPFLLLGEGDPCDSFLLAESERLLRAQHHLADAEITTEPADDGGVVLRVKTVDEIPVIVGGGIRRSSLSSVRYGNRNILGLGQLVALGWREGFAYRDGFDVSYLNSHVLGQPYRFRVAVTREPLGSELRLAAGRPFLTSAQRGAWYIDVDREDGYYRFARRDKDPLSLPLERNRFAAGAVARAGGRTAGVFGGFFISHDRIEPGATAVIATDSGLIAADDIRLDDRFSAETSSGAGLVIGTRFLSYRTVRGFQSLMGVEDVARGVVSTTAIGRALDENTVVVSTDLYVGIGTDRSFVTLEAAWERQGLGSDWHDAVAAGRIAWYQKNEGSRTLYFAAEYAGVWRERQPFQLELGRDDGVRGYRGTGLAGARRLVVRGESRWVLGTLGEHIGVGAAAFSDVGTVWAGGIPFGKTTTPRPSIGGSLLLAIPRDSRRLLRLDIAAPLIPTAGAGFEVRVTAELPSTWREPRPVELVRTVAPRIAIFEWR